MPSIFKRKSQQADEAKTAVLQATAAAPAELRPLINALSELVWQKNYKMAESRCKQHADELDTCPPVRDALCKALPGYAEFVKIRLAAKETGDGDT